MDIATIVGAVAAVASTSSFLPQALKVIRTRETKDISAGMYAITITAFALWTLYGAMQSAWPLVASNSISFVLSSFILAMKLLPEDGKAAVAQTLAPIAGGQGQEPAPGKVS